MEVRKRFYWQKNADGTKTKVYYHPVTSAPAVIVDSNGTKLDAKLTSLDSKCDNLINAEAKALLQTILSNAVYVSDQSSNITLLISKIGATGSSGGSSAISVATPTLSVNGATLTAMCATSGATIYYTNDGSTPTSSSTQYSSAITMVNGKTYKFIAIKDGVSSSVSSHTYNQAVTTYSITNNLTNCSNSNSASTINQGSSYSATISANSGYTLGSVVVTMGGQSVAVTNGVISISSVSGNIVITASASQSASTPSDNIIQFEDSAVKAVCLQKYDTDSDGEISKTEANAVQILGGYGYAHFKGNTSIVSFKELQYFTGLTAITGTSSWGAFDGCSKLKYIKMPSQLTKISGSCAFRNCTSLTDVDLCNVVELGEMSFMGCPLDNTDLTKLTILGISCLSSVNQQNISLPNIISIGNSAFVAAKMETIELGASITSIGLKVFRDCPNLTKVKILATTPPSYTYGNDAGVKVFPTSTIVYVPDNAMSAYQADDNWVQLYNEGKLKPISEY